MLNDGIMLVVRRAQHMMLTRMLGWKRQTVGQDSDWQNCWMGTSSVKAEVVKNRTPVNLGSQTVSAPYKGLKALLTALRTS